MPVLHLHAHVFVRRAPAAVADYLATVPHAIWRTDLADSAWESTGPLRVGSVLSDDLVVAGRTLRTESIVTGLLPVGGFSFEHRSGAVPMSGEIRVAPYDDGARVDYSVTMKLAGGWALLTPILRFSRPQVMASSLDELRFRLEAAVLPRHPVPAGH